MSQKASPSPPVQGPSLSPSPAGTSPSSWARVNESKFESGLTPTLTDSISVNQVYLSIN